MAKLKYSTSYFSFVLLVFSFHRISAQWSDRHEERFEGGNYIVGWKVNFDIKKVLFDLTVKTRGYVGFGLSPNGGMTGSDIIIGGVDDENSAVYFNDRYAIGNSVPIVDSKQDWQLIGASQNSTHTMLDVMRDFNTCDNQDRPFTNDTMRIIWSYGLSDYLTYHSSNRGTRSVNFFEPSEPPFDSTHFDRWDIIVNTVMPRYDTSYWCTMHRTPMFSSKQHVVAFEPNMISPDALRHTHHFNVYKCFPPDGEGPEYFEQFVGFEGHECYLPPSEGLQIPIEHCYQILYTYALGGKRMVFPENVAYPVGDDSQVEYYMLEMHYDNPTQREGVQFETGVSVYYTEQLRPIEAGVLLTGHQVHIGITVPPNSTDFIIAGHCSSECTNANFPQEGVNVFNALLHSHLAGRKMKVRHFRQNQELPWIINDDNYDFNFQQNRQFREEVRLLPGDHITVECTYDSMWKSSSNQQTTIGGFSTREEMCEAFLWYWPRSPLKFCNSGYPRDEIYKRFGIEEMIWGTPNEEPIVTLPLQWTGYTYTQVLDRFVQWTPAVREALQQELRYGQQRPACWGASLKQNPTVTYPEIDEPFEPIEECN